MSSVPWRVARVTPLSDLTQPSRMTAVAVRLVVQLFLVWCLWRALYASAPANAVLSEGQAVTYALIAVLAIQLRGGTQVVTRDSVLHHVQHGTILYWFLRPLSPRRYHLLRAIGEQAYGLAWMAAGYLLCLAAGWIQPPASALVATVSTVSLLCAQVLTYQLLLAVDLLSFWTLQNEAALTIVRFLQNLLAGAIAPLWFFPEWFLTLSWFVPFRYTLDVPLSIYIGRISVADTPLVIAGQLAWGVLLVGANRILWRRATRHVSVQGG